MISDSTTPLIQPTTTVTKQTTNKSTPYLTEQSTENSSVENTSEDESTGIPEDSKDKTWVILVAVLPIFAGLIFLIGLKIRLSKVLMHCYKWDAFLQLKYGSWRLCQIEIFMWCFNLDSFMCDENKVCVSESNYWKF